MSKLERKSDGKLWAFTSVGSYPIVYLTKDGGELCAACANGENGSEASETSADPQWRLIGATVNWEGSPSYCDHCNAELETAYGDPNDPA